MKCRWPPPGDGQDVKRKTAPPINATGNALFRLVLMAEAAPAKTASEMHLHQVTRRTAKQIQYRT